MRFRILIALWLATDLLLFIASFATAYFLRVGFIFSTDFPFDRFFLIATITAPAWLLVLLVTRTFALTREQTSLRSMSYIAFAGLVGTAFFALSYYFAYGAFFSRLLLVYALAIVILLTVLWHMLFQAAARVALRRNPPTFPTLVIGVTRESALLIKLLQEKRNPLTPVGILDAGGAKEREIAGVPVLGKLNKLEEILSQKNITHMIQCSDREQSLNLLSACRNRGITYIALPSIFGFVDGDESMTALEGKLVTTVRPRRELWSWLFG